MISIKSASETWGVDLKQANARIALMVSTGELTFSRQEGGVTFWKYEKATKIVSKCEFCGKESAGKNRFCSQLCRTRRRGEFVCQRCGAKFEAIYKPGNKRKFCGDPCENAHRLLKFKAKPEALIDGVRSENRHALDGVTLRWPGVK